MPKTREYLSSNNKDWISVEREINTKGHTHLIYTRPSLVYVSQKFEKETGLEVIPFGSDWWIDKNSELKI